jgi:hypothetical protein
VSEQPTTRRSATDRHIDTVRVSLSRGIVEIPWTSRTALLGQIRSLDSAKPIIDAFEAVGVSRPLALTREQKGLLVESIDFWGNQTDGGLRELPEGLSVLRNALHDDLHDAETGSL